MLQGTLEKYLKFKYLCQAIPVKDRSQYLAQIVKNFPVMLETRVQSLGWEDPLEKEMATHSGILAWRIPLTEEPGGLYGPWGHKELDTTERLTHNE